MSSIDEQFRDNLDLILRKGKYEFNERTGESTYRYPFTSFRLDVGEEFPLLTSKETKWKTAVDEMIWIYIRNSVDTSELRSGIWSKNAYPDGTIGKSYGYQAGKPVHIFDRATNKTITYSSQLEYIIETLKKDRSSRQCVLNLWDPEDIAEMSLPPCIVGQVWNVIDGRVNCMVTQRSGDYALGVPFDIFEAAVLMHIVARELGVKPGILQYNIGDSHIYANHVDTVRDYLNNYESYPAPILTIAEKSWKELTTDDFAISNYQHGPYISFKLNA